jgi:hypothetical protein
MSLLVLLGLLPAFVNADSVVNECHTGSECAKFGYKYYMVKLYCFEIILFNTFAIGIHEPKVKTTSTIIQTTRLGKTLLL